MAENAFRVLTIRSAGTTAQPALYPLLSPKSGEIIAQDREDEEGLAERYCRASGVTVSRIIDGQERPILSLRRLNVLVFVTARRLALACERYPTASVLAVAGPGSGLAARGVTARVSRLQGSAMVGHMRYPWIRSVSALPRTWRFGRDTLAIEYSVPERTPMLLRLDLRLPRGLTPVAMAAEICSRGVRYWLDNAPDLPQEVKGKLTELGRRAATDTTEPDRRRAEVYELPIWYPVTGAVPFLRRPRPLQPPYDKDQGGED